MTVQKVYVFRGSAIMTILYICNLCQDWNVLVIVSRIPKQKHTFIDVCTCVEQRNSSKLGEILGNIIYLVKSNENAKIRPLSAQFNDFDIFL